MSEGFVIEDGLAYYCSQECLEKNMTQEEYLELYDDGNGDSYWTQWEEDDDDEEIKVAGLKEWARKILNNDEVGDKGVYMRTSYIAQLPIEIQRKINKKLILLGLSEADIEKAMSSRLCDLEETINIDQISICNRHKRCNKED
jgi:hypothetical protein